MTSYASSNEGSQHMFWWKIISNIFLLPFIIWSTAWWRHYQVISPRGNDFEIDILQGSWGKNIPLNQSFFLIIWHDMSFYYKYFLLDLFCVLCDLWGSWIALKRLSRTRPYHLLLMKCHFFLKYSAVEIIL